MTRTKHRYIISKINRKSFSSVCIFFCFLLVIKVKNKESVRKCSRYGEKKSILYEMTKDQWNLNSLGIFFLFRSTRTRCYANAFGYV